MPGSMESRDYYFGPGHLDLDLHHAQATTARYQNGHFVPLCGEESSLPCRSCSDPHRAQSGNEQPQGTRVPTQGEAESSLLQLGS